MGLKEILKSEDEKTPEKYKKEFDINQKYEFYNLDISMLNYLKKINKNDKNDDYNEDNEIDYVNYDEGTLNTEEEINKIKEENLKKWLVLCKRKK